MPPEYWCYNIFQDFVVDFFQNIDQKRPTSLYSFVAVRWSASVELSVLNL